jgi:hypothetical protein
MPPAAVNQPTNNFIHIHADTSTSIMISILKKRREEKENTTNLVGSQQKTTKKYTK